MRRDYRQAVGVARWLALSGMAPPALRLPAGIEHLTLTAPDERGTRRYARRR
jgi:hypothetical protein